MDETVNKAKPKRQAQVRLEKLDADTVRKISRDTGISVPYLLREAVQLLDREHRSPKQKYPPDPAIPA